MQQQMLFLDAAAASAAEARLCSKMAAAERGALKAMLMLARASLFCRSRSHIWRTAEYMANELCFNESRGMIRQVTGSVTSKCCSAKAPKTLEWQDGGHAIAFLRKARLQTSAIQAMFASFARAQ